jgi:hypothetical protein
MTKYMLMFRLSVPTRHPLTGTEVDGPVIVSNVVRDDDPVRCIDRALAILELERNNLASQQDVKDSPGDGDSLFDNAAAIDPYVNRPQG